MKINVIRIFRQVKHLLDFHAQHLSKSRVYLQVIAKFVKIFLESSDHYLLYICSSFNHFSTYESKSLLHPFLSPSNFSLFDRCFVIIRQNKKRKLSLNIIEMYTKFIKRTNRVIFEKTSSIHDQMRRKIDEEKVKKKGKGVFAAKEMDGRRQNTENRSQLSPGFRSSLSINR